MPSIFGSHVGRGSYGGSGNAGFGSAAILRRQGRPGQAEVGNDGALGAIPGADEDDIGRFEIAMHHACVMGSFQGAC
ncbi:MAG: hypothetical protein ABI806_25405 [Candidatus Solibacter sp.]